MAQCQQPRSCVSWYARTAQGAGRTSHTSYMGSRSWPHSKTQQCADLSLGIQPWPPARVAPTLPTVCCLWC